MRRACAAVVCVLLTGLVCLSASQDRTGSVSGVLTDTTGRGLPGATIVVVSEQQVSRGTVTNSAGAYHLGGLNGRYLIEARMNGFVTKMGEAVVDSGRDAIWSGALLVGQPFERLSIERQVVRVVGLEAIDCGRHSAPASEAALRHALDCGLASVRAHRPFSVIVQFTESGPQTGRGLLAGSDGLVHTLDYDSASGAFSLQPCPHPAVNAGRNRLNAGFEFTCRAALEGQFGRRLQRANAADVSRTRAR
ncbi:MAG: carboxypeptidase-like regulatory domain-containing protein [Acidobacteriota bacterium]